MNSDNKNQQVTEKGSKLPIIIIMIICIFVGFVAGSLVISGSDKGLNRFYNHFYNYTGYIIPPILFCISFVSLILSAYFLIKGNKLIKSWNESDEKATKSLEKRLSAGVILLSTTLVSSFVNYAVTFSYFKAYESDFLYFVLIAAYLLVMIIFYTVLQQGYTALSKKINPNRICSIFGVKISPSWEKYCDDEQKMSIYKAGYKAYKITSYACVALWVILFLTDITFNTGVLPIIVVSIIWMVVFTSFSYFSFKNSFHGDDKNEDE